MKDLLTVEQFSLERWNTIAYATLQNVQVIFFTAANSTREFCF